MTRAPLPFATLGNLEAFKVKGWLQVYRGGEFIAQYGKRGSCYPFHGSKDSALWVLGKIAAADQDAANMASERQEARRARVAAYLAARHDRRACQPELAL